MTILTCIRCGQAGEGLPIPPYPDELGVRIQRSVCASCWREYMGRQTMVINEYRLDLLDPRAQEILTRDMIEFLGLEGDREGGASKASDLAPGTPAEG